MCQSSGLITAEKLTGQGYWLQLERQAGYEDTAVTQVHLYCLKAWEKIQAAGKPTLPFSKLKQRLNEPYVDFIVRLQDNLRRTIAHPDLREMLLQILAYDNANTECQRVIQPLKAVGAGMEDYIKACAHVGSPTYQANSLATAMKGRSRGNLRNLKCFGCGKQRHMKRDCRSQKRAKELNVKNKLPSVCPKCRKGKHWSNECRSKFDKDDNPINESQLLTFNQASL